MKETIESCPLHLVHMCFYTWSDRKCISKKEDQITNHFKIEFHCCLQILKGSSYSTTKFLYTLFTMTSVKILKDEHLSMTSTP